MEQSFIVVICVSVIFIKDHNVTAACLCSLFYCKNRRSTTTSCVSFVYIYAVIFWHEWLIRLPLFLRGPPLRRLPQAAQTLPCLRSMPRLPLTPHQVKVPQRPPADCQLSTLALHIRAQSTRNIPSSESIRALSTMGATL